METKQKMHKKIMLIGPMYAKDMRNAGGVTVLFEQMLEDLRELGVEHLPVNSNKNCYSGIAETFFVVMKTFLTNIRRYDHVSLHGTANHYIMIAPFVIFFAKMFGKTVSLRKFAGNFNEIYENGGAVKKALIRYVLKNADLSYFETKYLVEYFQKFNPHTYWFPNVRRRPKGVAPKSDFKRRFVYISHLKDEKGTQELLEACKRLDDSFDVTIYGPVHEEKYTPEYIAKYNTRYAGPLTPAEVVEKLKEADVLVLPSHREGYPGIVIEAFSVGRPVLVTNLPAIAEIVEEGKTGVLVEPKNVDALVEGFYRFDEKNYAAMSQNAYNAFDAFDSLPQTKRFLKMVDALS